MWITPGVDLPFIRFSEADLLIEGPQEDLGQNPHAGSGVREDRPQFAPAQDALFENVDKSTPGRGLGHGSGA